MPRGPQESYAMYEVTLIVFFAATVFFPSFIGIRARTNAGTQPSRR